MTDMSPAAVLPTVSGRITNAADSIKPGQTAYKGGPAVETESSEGYFHNFFQNLLSSKTGVSESSTEGSTIEPEVPGSGDDLPLESDTPAEFGHLSSQSVSREVRNDNNMRLLDALAMNSMQVMNSVQSTLSTPLPRTDPTSGSTHTLSPGTPTPAKSQLLQQEVMVEKGLLLKAESIVDSTKPELSEPGPGRTARLPLSLDGKNRQGSIIATSFLQGQVNPTLNQPLSSQGEPVINASQIPSQISQISQISDAHQLVRFSLPNQIQENIALASQTPTVDTVNASLVSGSMSQIGVTTESTWSLPVQATISQALGQPDWSQGMSRQVLLMVNQSIRSAELRLNPAHLGPIEVRIDMDDEQVSIAFSSRHAGVRDAVEQALPKLREMFDENGLNLTEADISQYSFAEQRERAFKQEFEQQPDYLPTQSKADGTEKKPVENNPVEVQLGLIDYYI